MIFHQSQPERAKDSVSAVRTKELRLPSSNSYFAPTLLTRWAYSNNHLVDNYKRVRSEIIFRSKSNDKYEDECMLYIWLQKRPLHHEMSHNFA